MGKVDSAAYYAKNIGLVHHLARKAYGRLQGIGAAMPYDDMVQELSLVFLRAYELFDPNMGNKFSTYFTFAAYNRINKIVETYEIERVRLNIRSVEEIDSYTDCEGSGSFAETVPCDRQRPDEAYEAKRTAQDIYGNLSPLAKLIVGWLAEPPAFVLSEFAKAQAHVEYSKSLGYSKRAVTGLRILFICDLIRLVSDVSKAEISYARDELKAVIDCEGKYEHAR